MTEVDVDKVMEELEQTTVGYAKLKVKPPTDKNSHWYKALVLLGEIEGEDPPPPPPPPPVQAAYGCPWNADSLGNLEIGKYAGRAVSYRFKAARAGQISSGRFFFIYRSGYGLGDGGDVRIEVCRDESGLPGTAVTSALITDPMGGNYRTVTWAPVPVTAGEILHLVMINVASDPVNNYVSVDDMYQSNPGSQMQPEVADSDLAVVWRFRTGDPWQLNRKHTPIFQVVYEDGSWQGQTYSDFRSSSGKTTLGSVTESISASATRSFTKVHARVQGTGTLTFDLAGKSVTVPANVPSKGWVSADLAVTLQAGQTYQLKLTSGGQLTIYPYEKGSAHGFKDPFPDGRGRSSSEDWPVYLT